MTGRSCHFPGAGAAKRVEGIDGGGEPVAPGTALEGFEVHVPRQQRRADGIAGVGQRVGQRADLVRSPGEPVQQEHTDVGVTARDGAGVHSEGWVSHGRAEYQVG